MAWRRYYSQGGEDMLLWELFAGNAPGIFIDVGAFDGMHLSNSYSFEQQGWTGICVEAHPDFFPHCRRNRPGSACVHAACVGSPEVASVPFRTEPLGLLSGISADQTPHMPERYARRGMKFPGFRTVHVPATTLDGLIARHLPPRPRIEFVSIDVEGTEIDVLRGFHHVARVLIVEANTPAAGEELVRFLEPQGYLLARTIAPNLIFARTAADVAILRDARVSGFTEKTIHPLGAEATLPEHSQQWISLG